MEREISERIIAHLQNVFPWLFKASHQYAPAELSYSEINETNIVNVVGDLLCKYYDADKRNQDNDVNLLYAAYSSNECDEIRNLLRLPREVYADIQYAIRSEMCNWMCRLSDPSLDKSVFYNRCWKFVLLVHSQDHLDDHMMSQFLHHLDEDALDELNLTGRYSQNMGRIFMSIYSHIQQELSGFCVAPRQSFRTLSILSDSSYRKPLLLEWLLECNTVAKPSDAIQVEDFENTLFGQLMIGCDAPKPQQHSRVWQTCGFFKGLLQNPAYADRILQWFARCQYQLEITANTTVRNPTHKRFLSGLAAVLTRLSLDLLTTEASLMSIDPTYCARPESVCAPQTICLEAQPCLLSTSRNSSRPVAGIFSQTTHLFYMAHWAIHRSYRYGWESAQREQFRTASQDTSGTAIRCFDEHTLHTIVTFYEATGRWLNQVALRPSGAADRASNCYAPHTEKPIQLPLQSIEFDEPGARLRLDCVPEFMVRNINGFVWYLHQCADLRIAQRLVKLDAMFTMLLILGTDHRRTESQQLRSELLTGLGVIVYNLRPQFATFYADLRSTLLLHPHWTQMVPCLLQSCSYMRRMAIGDNDGHMTMYRMFEMLAFLLSLAEHQSLLQALACLREELSGVNRVDRFVHSLLDDVNQLVTDPRMHPSAQWSASKPMDIRPVFYYLTVIEALVAHAKFLFANSTALAGRLATTLDCLLRLMVQPPLYYVSLLHIVSTVYTRMSDNREFVAAVVQTNSADDTDKLFAGALRIMREKAVVEEQQCAVFEAFICDLRQEHVVQEALQNAPDEFLDAISAQLMLDPVRLPVSEVTVDRSTVLRHFLSEPTDPYNRTPLRLDQLQPDEDLRRRIEAWQTQIRRETLERLRLVGDT